MLSLPHISNLLKLIRLRKCSDGIPYYLTRLCFVLIVYLLAKWLFSLTCLLLGLMPQRAQHDAPELLLPTMLRDIKWQRERDKILEKDLQPFIDSDQLVSSLKNPCWFEEENRWSPYENNTYMIRERESVKTEMERLQQTWRSLRNQSHRTGATPLLRRFRCMPFFHIIGMPKCGTTDLYERLQTHPQIESCLIKEPMWWTQTRFGILSPYVALYEKRGILPNAPPATFADYLDLFDLAAEKILRASTIAANQDQIVGEASTSLMWSNDAWLNYRGWRIADGEDSLSPLVSSHLAHLNPKVKLIVILRNPVTRLFSSYRFQWNSQRKTAENFHAQVVAAVRILETCLKSAPLKSCVYAPEIHSANLSGVPTPLTLRRGLYHVFLREWLRNFPRKQILILRLEDYARNVSAALEKVRQFLGLKTEFVVDDKTTKKIVNRGHVDIGPMKEETAELLRKFYSPHNKKLAEMLDDESFLWN